MMYELLSSKLYHVYPILQNFRLTCIVLQCTQGRVHYAKNVRTRTVTNAREWVPCKKMYAQHKLTMIESWKQKKYCANSYCNTREGVCIVQKNVRTHTGSEHHAKRCTNNYAGGHPPHPQSNIPYITCIMQQKSPGF